jgi:hypothetical protein
MRIKADLYSGSTQKSVELYVRCTMPYLASILLTLCWRFQRRRSNCSGTEARPRTAARWNTSLRPVNRILPTPSKDSVWSCPRLETSRFRHFREESLRSARSQHDLLSGRFGSLIAYPRRCSDGATVVKSYSFRIDSPNSSHTLFRIFAAEKQPQSVENRIGELIQWHDFLANENCINRCG